MRKTVPLIKNSYDTWKKSFVSEPVYLSNASSAPSPSTVAEESEEEEIILRQMDTLVWSWTAAGLIKSEQNGDVGAVAIRCFERLMQLKYILHSGYDHLHGQMMYKLGNDKTEFLNKQSLGVRHRNGLDSETDVEKIQHLSLIFEGIDKINFDILRNSRHLKTLLLHQCSGSGLENLLHDVLLELKSLTILDLSCTEIVELPSSLECLKGLKYLDLSETPIRRLPEWTDSLCNLETLILVGCLNLCGLPKCMYKMIKLQHLVLDIARQLQSMPIGMGKLTNLQTLSAFLVGKKDGNRITQLRNMNKLKGSLYILKLENISNKDEARDARLHDKLHLTKLDFVWSDLQDAKFTSEREILEHLQPHFGLQELKIVSYSGGSLPSWISDPSFTQITSITLYGCRYCERLPSLGELPSLKILNIVDMDELVVIDRFFYQQQANQRQNAFPRLEKLSFDGMSNLENMDRY
ncbi:UNVERIFIED_CONTAM: putative disease resistance protein RGA1 [Sesamum angustifolium]|uniref:Disease resistance protein RGA1 n=1 Tax=Sesamum angustifolium TaxID=2727405 RepID=A0AAW2PW32_9LAMI